MKALVDPGSLAHPMEKLKRYAIDRLRFALQNGKALSGRSVYIIADTPSLHSHKKRINRFFREKGYPTDGCYIVGMTVCHAWVVEENFQSFDELYQKLQQHGLESLPTVIVDYGSSTIEYMYSGIEEETDPEPLIQNEELSLSLCERYLERIEKRYLCSWEPNKLWSNPNQWITVQRLEKTIQDMIEPAFRLLVPDNVSVISEPSGVDGRADIFLLPESGNDNHRAIYELKAIKDASGNAEELKKGKAPTRYSPQVHKREIAKGARQALSYAGTYDANIKILAVFDGCKEKQTAIFNAFEAPCWKRGVKLAWVRFWPTKEDMRKELIPAIGPEG